MTDHSSLQKEKNNTDIVERLTHFCTDWDGSAMNDHSNPMDGLHCLDLREAAAEITRLRAEAEELRSVMIAAAEEIQAHWPAHCDAEGYGPANLMRRLEDGIPSQYAYTAGDFERLRAEFRLPRSAARGERR